MLCLSDMDSVRTQAGKVIFNTEEKKIIFSFELLNVISRGLEPSLGPWKSSMNEMRCILWQKIFKLKTSSWIRIWIPIQQKA